MNVDLKFFFPCSVVETIDNEVCCFAHAQVTWGQQRIPKEGARSFLKMLTKTVVFRQQQDNLDVRHALAAQA